MRANRMTGTVTAAADHAYATLARLKIVLPLAQAATLTSGENGGTSVLTLIDLTRDLTEQLAESTFHTLERLDVSRRERLLRSIAQEVAYQVGRVHERGGRIDAANLIEQVRIAQSAIDQVPGASLSPPFEESLGAQAQWQLAVARASARLVESLMLDPIFAKQYCWELLANLLKRVDTATAAIDTKTPDEHRTVRLSLLAQFTRSHSRLIFGRLMSAVTSGSQITITKLIAEIDAYHQTLDVALSALEAPKASSAASIASVVLEHDFLPAI